MKARKKTMSQVTQLGMSAFGLFLWVMLNPAFAQEPYDPSQEPGERGKEPYGDKEGEYDANVGPDGIVYGAKNNPSHMFVGGGLGFGQARPTDSGSTPGLIYLFSAEVGYSARLSHWSKFLGSVQFISGQASYRLKKSKGGTIQMPIGIGAIANIGYGKSLGNKLFGVFSIGAGPVATRVKAEPEGVSYESDGTVSGLAAKAAYALTMPVSDTFDIAGGLSWTHFSFNVDKLKESGGRVRIDGRQYLFNAPQADLSLRLKF